MFRSKSKDRKPTKKKQFFIKKIKSCPLSAKGAPEIDYKNVKLLEKYISEKGKIIHLCPASCGECGPAYSEGIDRVNGRGSPAYHPGASPAKNSRQD